MARVSSAVLDAWKDRALAAEARYDALLEKYHALRDKGAYAPHPGRVVPPPPDPLAEAMRRREEEVVEQLSQTIAQASHVPPEIAQQEAARIRRVGLQTFTDA